MPAGARAGNYYAIPDELVMLRTAAASSVRVRAAPAALPRMQNDGIMHLELCPVCAVVRRDAEG